MLALFMGNENFIKPSRYLLSEQCPHFLIEAETYIYNQHMHFKMASLY